MRHADTESDAPESGAPPRADGRALSASSFHHRSSIQIGMRYTDSTYRRKGSDFLDAFFIICVLAPRRSMLEP
jgi:hypothetical protein